MTKQVMQKQHIDGHVVKTAIFLPAANRDSTWTKFGATKQNIDNMRI